MVEELVLADACVHLKLSDSLACKEATDVRLDLDEPCQISHRETSDAFRQLTLVDIEVALAVSVVVGTTISHS